MLVSLRYLSIFLACISGGYGSQSSDIPPDTPLASLISMAKSHLTKGSPRDALHYFDVAVSRDPTNYLTVFHRGATYLSLGKDAQASHDFDRVLELKPGFEGALLQRARIKTRSGDWAGAKQDLDVAGKKSSVEYEELEEAQTAAQTADEAEKKGDWETCVSQAGIAIVKANMAVHLRQLRLQCRLQRGDVQEAISDLGHILQVSPGSVEPHLQISSMLFYSLGDTNHGVAQIRKCLHSDPDSKACGNLFRRQKQVIKRLDQLSDLMEKRKFTNAANLMAGVDGDGGLIGDIIREVKDAKDAGYIHPAAPNYLRDSLVERTCEVYRAMGSPKKAKPYCTEALSNNPKSLHGLLFKAQAYIDSEDFEQAVNTLASAKEHHSNSNELHTLLQKAQILLKRSKQKDYYKVLGVSRDADERTIKRSYRQLTKIHHPDKVISQGVTKEDAEKRMASINEAYEVLSDPELKARYDNGDDPNDPQRGGNPFQGQQFHQGHQQFFFQQGGGPQFKFSGQGFNFPGGFPFG
ncbi:hypothetical protein V8E54_003396 [Elaphomyces granulatus]